MIVYPLRLTPLKSPLTFNTVRTGLGKSWLGALLFSIAVSVIFAQVFSYTVGMDVWLGFATFVVVLLVFYGFIVLHGRRRKTEQFDQLSELRRLRAYDLKDEEDF